MATNHTEHDVATVRKEIRFERQGPSVKFHMCRVYAQQKDPGPLGQIKCWFLDPSTGHIPLVGARNDLFFKV